MNRSRTVLLLAIIATLALFFAFGGQHYLTLETLKGQQAYFADYRDQHRTQAIVLYSLIYIIATGLSIPGAAVLTLAGGALFGLVWGTVIVSFASTIGATLAFWSARFLFREQVARHFGKQLNTIDEGIARDGPFYLFTLRLVPIFPFFAINVLMGLSNIKTQTFYWYSQVGMLPGTLVYVNAGTQLGTLDSLADVLSPGIGFSFVLLGLFPLIAKKIADAVQAAKVYRGWDKPKLFDTNVLVIGAGAAGLVTAYIAAAVKAKVMLVEKQQMGGDCLNTGCVPSKALIRSAKALAQIRKADGLGIQIDGAKADFAQVMARVHKVIEAIAPHDSVERYQSLGVEVVIGSATIVSPWQVDISGEGHTRSVTSRAIVIAAGAKTLVPNIEGLAETGYLTSDTLWQLTELPQRLLVLGGGPIGCELAQAFARLGSQVTVVELLPRLLMREDSDVSEMVEATFADEGITVLTGHKALRFARGQEEKVLYAEHEDENVRIVFDQVLLALGRSANIEGYGAEALGIRLSERKTLAVDDFQATNYPNIFACGDVAGPYQFTHVAAHQAWYAAINALFGNVKKFRTDYSAIPWATFTDPEVARAGLNEQDAQAQGIAYEKTVYNIDDLDRAIADQVNHGFVKVLTRPGSDKILGVTLVGEQAGELIAEFVLAMRHNLGLNKILGTLHIYPTLAEANKYVAGHWKRGHAPNWLLKQLERYHQWRRG